MKNRRVTVRLGKDGRFYDRTYDFNQDGKLDAYVYSVMQDVVFGKNSSGSYDKEEELEDELEMAGIDCYELENMNEDERRETIEDIGQDPDDYEDEF